MNLEQLVPLPSKRVYRVQKSSCSRAGVLFSLRTVSLKYANFIIIHLIEISQSILKAWSCQRVKEKIIIGSQIAGHLQKTVMSVYC